MRPLARLIAIPLVLVIRFVVFAAVRVVPGAATGARTKRRVAHVVVALFVVAAALLGGWIFHRVYSELRRDAGVAMGLLAALPPFLLLLIPALEALRSVREETSTDDATPPATSPPPPALADDPGLTYERALVRLLAWMMMVDEHVHQTEVAAYMAEARRLLGQGVPSAELGAELEAAKHYPSLEASLAALETVATPAQVDAALLVLWQMATADGELSTEEASLLGYVAHRLGVSQIRLDAIVAAGGRVDQPPGEPGTMRLEAAGAPAGGDDEAATVQVAPVADVGETVRLSPVATEGSDGVATVRLEQVRGGLPSPVAVGASGRKGWVSYVGPDGERRRVEVSAARPVATVGRAADQTIRRDDPSVAERHARIEYGGGWCVLAPVDPGRLDYVTLVNGNVVTGPAVLQEGDVIQAGELRMTFSAAG